MDNYVYIGKIINTFGIKGELKVLSDFEYIERAFKSDNHIYIKDLDEILEVDTYRRHQNYYLLSFKGYTNINDVLKYKAKDIYIKRSELKLNANEYLLRDLIGMEVYDGDLLIGTVVDYEFTINNVLLKVNGKKSFYIPNIPEYIKSISIEDKKIYTNKGSDLIL